MAKDAEREKFQRAMEALSQADFPVAIELLGEVVVDDSTNGEAWLQGTPKGKNWFEREYATAMMLAVAGTAGTGGAPASVDLPVALGLSVAVVVVGFLLGAWRLGRFEVAEAA